MIAKGTVHFTIPLVFIKEIFPGDYDDQLGLRAIVLDGVQV
jgi:hypothetical protein